MLSMVIVALANVERNTGSRRFVTRSTCPHGDECSRSGLAPSLLVLQSNTHCRIYLFPCFFVGDGLYPHLPRRQCESVNGS